MKKLSIKKENRDYLEFDNGMYYDVESGYLTSNKSNISVPEVLPTHCQNYREVIPQLELPLTHRCNLDCVYCSFRKRMNDRTDLDMPWNIIEKAVTTFKNYLEREKIHYARIDFGVTGEPFLRKEIFEDLFLFIDKTFANSNIKRIWVGPYISNATKAVVNNSLIDFCNVQDISCDGPKEIHDKMRTYPNGKGSFDDVISSMNVLNGSAPRFGVSTVLTAQNSDFTRIFNYLSKELKFCSIYMKPANLNYEVPYSLNYNNIDKYKEAYTELINSILKQNQNEILNSLLSLNKDDFFMRFFYRIKNRSKQIYRCGSGKSGIYVDTDGSLYPCAHFIGINERKIGNISMGFDEKKRREFFKLTTANREHCSSCWARNLCGGGCYYQSYLVNNTINVPDQVKCILIKHLIIEAIRMYIFLETNYPEIINALPSTYYLANNKKDEGPLDVYVPISKLVYTQSPSLLPLITKKSIKGTLNTNIPQIYFSLKINESKIHINLQMEGHIDFDIEFWLCNLDKYDFLNEDLYNFDSYPYSDIFTIKSVSNASSCAFKQKKNYKPVQRIPYSFPEWEQSNEIVIKKNKEQIDIFIDINKIYLSFPKKIGFNINFKFSEGFTSLVLNEPFCLLETSKSGNYTLKSNEFNESIILKDRLKENSMFPIDRWRGMCPNVC